MPTAVAAAWTGSVTLLVAVTAVATFRCGRSRADSRHGRNSSRSWLGVAQTPRHPRRDMRELVGEPQLWLPWVIKRNRKVTEQCARSRGHHDDPSGQVDRLAHRVGHEQGGKTAGEKELQQLVVQPLPGHFVDSAERLVE